MSTVIKVENLSKQYRLGLVGTRTFKEDTQRWWAKLRGKQDPFIHLGVENDRTIMDDSKFVWSLKDIDFEVKQGDVLGVIGKNGAGKSTLLKILSKVTAPTTGSVKVKGRIASLLEVGTGFHPELTGRENIYLNGAILGMRKHEIKSKLDEIIDFAGVERYIDTPVKRYSSGMYVRLAFAVAAHLENEILIIDEILAVGDSEFQKKCLGKMGEVSQGEGRTVLFVSHNLNAIQSLCNKGLYLKNGNNFFYGDINDTVNLYLKQNSKDVKYREDVASNSFLSILNISIYNNLDRTSELFDVNSELTIEFNLKNFNKKIKKYHIGFNLKTIKDDVLFGSGNFFEFNELDTINIKCIIPSNLLNDNSYSISLFLHDSNMNLLFDINEVLVFDIVDSKRNFEYYGKIDGYFRPTLCWEINSKFLL